MGVRTRWVGTVSAIAAATAPGACDLVDFVAGVPAMLRYTYGQGAAVRAHPVPRAPETLLERGARNPLNARSWTERMECERKRMTEAWMESLGHGARHDTLDRTDGQPPEALNL